MPKKLHPYYAVELLIHNIKVVLNNLAPMKRRVLRLKTSAHWLSKDLRTRIEARNLMMRNAYRAGKSTETAWADLDARIQKATDNCKYIGLLLVDMSAAFNLVDKQIIVPKLKRMGVGELAVKLIFSYLTCRKSRVKVKGLYSAWIAVKTGIGEGSVLGPLIFINSLLIHSCAQRG